MRCPVCQEELKLAERQGVEIDYCPKCRGVWLDRGELDKIIERSAYAGEEPNRPTHGREEQRQPPRPPSHQKDYGRHHKKRKSWLGEIFDFD